MKYKYMYCICVIKLSSYLSDVSYNVQQEFQSKSLHVVKNFHSFHTKGSSDSCTFGLDVLPANKQHKHNISAFLCCSVCVVICDHESCSQLKSADAKVFKYSLEFETCYERLEEVHQFWFIHFRLFNKKFSLLVLVPTRDHTDETSHEEFDVYSFNWNHLYLGPVLTHLLTNISSCWKHTSCTLRDSSELIFSASVGMASTH